MFCLPPVFFIADRARGVDPLAVVGRLPRGAGVIYRDYGRPGRAAMAAALAVKARRRGLVLLIAGDAKLARRVGAQGLHLPEWRLCRPLPPLRPGWIVTAAAHSRRAIARARARSVDAVLVSPVFSTASHPRQPALGPHRLARMASGTRVPVYALGGMNEKTARRLPAGIAGWAGIAAFS